MIKDQKEINAKTMVNVMDAEHVLLKDIAQEQLDIIGNDLNSPLDL